MLKRNLERAREKGFTFYAGPEMEFFYFRELRASPIPLDHAGFFDLTQHDMVSNLRKQTIMTLEAMGIPVEYSFHELGPSQHEIDLRYTDALTMADNVMTFRLVVKEVAHDLGVYATFMPKPIAGDFGSGMHTHLSLFEGDVNAFHDPGDEYGLSKVGKAFIAGLLRHAPRDHRGHEPVGELLQAAQHPVRGAGRTSAGRATTAPRSCGCPPPKRGKESSTRIEFRSPDPACNPYLAFSVILAAGPQGHRRGLRARARGDEQHLRDDARGARRRRHPRAARSRSARRSTSMEGSELVAEALGEHVFDYFIRNKRAEWADYRAQVTPFELERYLGTL